MELHLGVADGAREAEESEEELLSIFWKFTVRREPVQRGRLGLLGLQSTFCTSHRQRASACWSGLRRSHKTISGRICGFGGIVPDLRMTKRLGAAAGPASGAVCLALQIGGFAAPSSLSASLSDKSGDELPNLLSTSISSSIASSHSQAAQYKTRKTCALSRRRSARYYRRVGT